MAFSERAVALGVINAVLEDGAFTHLALAEALRDYDYLDRQQRAFITRLTEGTIERKITLDFVIDWYSKTPVRKMKPLIRGSIRMGVYQILYMDSVPDSAAVNESVRMVSKMYPGLKGFVNGVLRHIARDRDNAMKAIDEASLSIRYSMPQWIIDGWAKQYGMDTTISMLQAFLAPTKTCIRTNLARITPENLRQRLEADGVQVDPVSGLDYAFYISGYDRITGLPEYREGLFYVQDASSMLVAQRADIRAGDRILDVCAAPGGKSLHMAETLCDIEKMSDFLNPADAAVGLTISGKSGEEVPCGSVEARDKTEAKVALIRDNIQRSGLTNITAKVQDATVDDPESHDAFDIVVADLPCSGLGVMARKPDIRYRISQDEIIALSALQQDILKVVCQYVKPEGTLLYSTCTISQMENEDNVDAFLAEHKNFSLVYREQILPKEGENDGFFISVMRRNA